MGVIKRLAEAIFGKTTPAQRASAVGLVPGYPIANHYEEGNKVTNWNYVAMHAVAKQSMQATVTVSIKDDPKKPIIKSIAPDSPDESSTPQDDHPIAKLLDRPNAMTSTQEFLYQFSMQLRATGGCVIWDVRSADNKPVELYILPMAWLQYQQPTVECPLGMWRVYSPRGMTGYFRNNALANGFMLDVRDTFIPKYSHPLYPGEPLSPLTQCAQIIDIAEKSEEATVSALANSIRPSVVMSFRKGTPPEAEMERIKAKLAERNAGVHRTGEALLIGEDIDVKDLSQRMAELDAVNVREQNQKFNFQVQAVPSIATGGDNSGTYAGNAATINTHVELSIQPDLDLLSGKLMHRWGEIYSGIQIEINAKRMDDPTLQMQRSDKILAAVPQGAASINEWRSSMKLPPLPDGDKYEKAQTPGGPPGMPGAQPPAQPDAGPLDVPSLADDAADSDGTGVVDPMQQGMPAQVKRLAWLNGYRGHEGGVVTKTATVVRPIVRKEIAERPAVDVGQIVTDAIGKIGDQLVKAIKSQPAPTFNLSMPSHPFTVDVQHPDVNVYPTFNVDAPSVTVEQPNITVQSSVVPAPSVTVNVPKQDRPEVTVNVKPTPVKIESPVTVNLPERNRKISVVRDADGNVVSANVEGE